ncbi:MAG: preprotein translocase subunit SecE [Hadesarchaea archaeon YNP_N21]|jgi:protein transport protein SEC61 subunit gamma-like protein|nr:MAG: preprotein translocase subunit SecE [Hadesarchaea archaeon YNP_N21]
MLKNFVYECRRVLRVARKPDRDEYLQISRITGVGMILIGVLGFIITLISYLVGGMV